MKIRKGEGGWGQEKNKDLVGDWRGIYNRILIIQIKGGTRRISNNLR